MPQDAIVLPVGKKAVEFFQHRGCEILTEEYREAASVSIGDCYTIAKLVADGFLEQTYQNVVLVYTNFVSLLAQTPAALPLLPLTISSEKRDDDNVKARVLGSDGKYRRKEQKEPYVDSQNVFMQEALQAKPPQEIPEKLGFFQRIRRIFHK